MSPGAVGVLRRAPTCGIKVTKLFLGCQVPVNTVCPASLPVILKEGQPAIRVKLAVWVHTLLNFKIKAQKQSAAENVGKTSPLPVQLRVFVVLTQTVVFYGDDGADNGVVLDVFV